MRVSWTCSIDPHHVREAGVEFAVAERPLHPGKGQAAFDEFLRGAMAIARVHDPVLRAPLIALLMRQAAAGAAAIAMKQVAPADILNRMRGMTGGPAFGGRCAGGRGVGGCAQA